MAGIYIHIPFCKSRCHYCDFHTRTSLEKQGEILSALASEMRQRQDFLEHDPLETLYIGGGTPSLYTPEELGSLIDLAREIWHPRTLTEVTVEVNPDDLTLPYLQELRQRGVNRLSIGVQSFMDRDLRWMNRRHSASKAIQAVQMARAAGFDNLSIDLIYGIPAMTLGEWESNIQQATDLGVEHISAYHLTIEPGTPFGKQKERGLLHEIEDEAGYEQFCCLQQKLNQAGYEQYEISNFCLPGRRAQHNSNYWKGVPYLGIGPSAHSYNGRERSANVASNTLYLKLLPTREQITTEELDETSRYNEYLMTALRTSDGVDAKVLREQFGAHKLHLFLDLATRYIRSGKMIEKEGHYAISAEHYFVSDGIISDFFVL